MAPTMTARMVIPGERAAVLIVEGKIVDIFQKIVIINIDLHIFLSFDFRKSHISTDMKAMLILVLHALSNISVAHMLKFSYDNLQLLIFVHFI